MSGVFGGALGLINAIGGAVLYVLIGERARSDSNSARAVRLTMGGAVIGLVIGFILFVTLPPFAELKPRYYGDVRESPVERRLLICFGLVTVVSVAVTWGLEAIRRTIDGGKR